MTHAPISSRHNGPLGSGRPSDVVISPDGSRIYTSWSDGTVRVYHGDTGELVRTWNVGAGLGAIDVSPDGRFLIVTAAQPVSSSYSQNTSDNRFVVAVYRFEVATGSITTFLHEATGVEWAFHDVAYIDDNNVLLTQKIAPGSSGLVNAEILNTPSGVFASLAPAIRPGSILSDTVFGPFALLTETGVPDAPLRLNQSPYGFTAYHGGYQDGVQGLNLGVQALGPTFIAQHVNGNGLHIYGSDLQYRFNLAGLHPGFIDNVAGLAFDSTGEFLFVLDTDVDSIVQLSTSTWEIVNSIPVGADLTGFAGDFGNRLLVAPTLRYFTVVTDSGLLQIDNPGVSSTLTGTGGDDVLVGTGLHDVLQGLGGNDNLSGRDGGDILDGGAGADAMTGGSGNDRYIVDDPGDSVVENASGGSDTVETSLADYAAPLGIEIVIGTLGAGMTQTLRGNARGHLPGYFSGNLLVGGDADNVFHVVGEAHDTVRGNGGHDTLHIDWSGAVGPVTGSSWSTDGYRVINGRWQTIHFTGVETVFLTTGRWNDDIGSPYAPRYGPVRTHISAGAGDDIAVVLTQDSFDGGSGIDGVRMNHEAPTTEPFEWRVPSNLFISPAGTPQLANIEYFLYAITGGGNDIVETGRLALTDGLATGAGDDLVTFYNGRDYLEAGAGFDTLVIDWRDSTDPVLLQSNYEILYDNSFRSKASSGADRSATFSEVERLVLLAGSAADSFSGSDRSDHLSGGGGGDTLAGGLGDDSIDGDDGDDLLSGGEGSDLLRGGSGVDGFDGGSEPAGFLGDRISFFEARATQGVVADLRTGIISNDGFGNSETMSGIESFGPDTAFADTFYGNDNSNGLIVGRGDFAYGFGGDDLIEAGLASALVDGGTGTDTLLVRSDGGFLLPDSNGDGVAETSAAMTAGWKIDLASGTVRDGFGNLGAVTGIENLVGSELADDLRGDGGDNVVEGGGGADLLRLYDGGNDTVLAGGGNDNIFFIDSLTGADIVNGGAGNDTLILQGNYAGGLTLTANVTNIELISILAGSNTNFGESGTGRYDYALTIHDANFAAGVQARINGSALLEGEDFTFDGSAETDARFVVYGGRGKDTLIGGQGNDIFFLAEERFASGDTVNGGAGYDGMFLRGNYTIDFNAPGYTGLFTNTENLTLTSATDERYARGGTEFDYDITLSDAIVKPGEILTVSGTLLMANETMILDGSAEMDGLLYLFGGKADDTLKGGTQADILHGNLGADQLTGNGGADSFRYQAVAESTAGSVDHILDFAAGTDKIDLSRIDSDSVAAGDQAFSWIGSNAFSGTAGQLRAYEQSGIWFVEGDVDGNGVADLVIQLTVTGGPLSQSDFLP